MPHVFPDSQPLNVFVHIPKTAGTTLNAALKKSGPGFKHVERILNKPNEALTQKVKTWAWVSGHVPYEDLHPRLTAVTERELRFFTILRDPVRQLASHYNWWFVIYRRGPHSYFRYGKYFRDLSRQIRRADNSDPKQIAAILTEHAPLFMNMQSKFVLNGYENWDTDAIRARLAEFRSIALNSQLSDVISEMTMGPAPQARAKNVAKYAFDPVVFEHPVLQECLAEHHGIDLALWRQASTKKTRPKARLFLVL